MSPEEAIDGSKESSGTPTFKKVKSPVEGYRAGVNQDVSN